MRKPDVMLVAVTCSDESLAVMHFVTAEYNADGTARWIRLATKEAVDAEIAKSAWDAGKLPIKGWRFLAGPHELPQDRTYRAAWKDTGKAVEHDMAKARDAHRERIRYMRKPALAELDAQWMRATGQGRDTKTIETARQRLRDLPADPAIDAANTVDDLKAIWPADLPG